ncbi:MAG: M20/M25/M40 family metallo-hydrolase [Chloroflexota bacterium]
MDNVSTPENGTKGMIAGINFLVSRAHNIKNELLATPHLRELLIEQMFAVAIVTLGAPGCKGGCHRWLFDSLILIAPKWEDRGKLSILCDEVREMVKVNEERLLRQFLDLLQVYSPSLQEGEIAALLERELTALGLEVWNDRTGQGETGNLIGLWRGDGQGVPIFLCAHMDTVEPAKGVRPVVEGGVVRSDGKTILGADCKAPIASILESIRIVREEGLPHGDIEVVFTYGEEKGMMGARTLDTSTLKARYGFVADAETAPGSIVSQGPAQDRFRVVFHGKPAHAGVEPEKGVNALVAAAKALSRMPLGRIDEETTANIGLIKGGTARNIVPDRVELEGEARSRDNQKLDGQTRAMVDAMESAAREIGAQLELDVVRAYESFSWEKDHPVVQMAWAAAEKAGLEPQLVSSGGGTDAHIIISKGIPTAVLGVGLVKPHSLEEHIKIEDMVSLTHQLVALIRTAHES